MKLLLALLLSIATPALAQEAKKKPPPKKAALQGKATPHGKATPEQIRRFNQLQEKQKK